jgi:predicted DNA-binding transcriptional regulator AlpA
MAPRLAALRARWFLETQMPRQTALPPMLAPRLISREAAAAYVCVSPNTFDEMVEDGRMPRPRSLGGKRRAWDVRALDAAIDHLPVQGDDAGPDETWGDVDAA